ncbi:MAG TPA: hypothetical protein VLA74_07735 [Nitrososphaeraceae archaeon]|jgi:hypothetical protein|nr:hypothetical protein [Nitrososphaeraceae archaeon]HSF50632.1 hypothetical protein [Nitrososphaeraceae archaeon]
MTDKGLNNRLERKRKLENELTGKISKDWNEFVKKSDEYMKEIQENNRQYYQQQLDKELDDMERDINSGNTIGAIYHRVAADNYLRLLNLL